MYRRPASLAVFTVALLTTTVATHAAILDNIYYNANAATPAPDPYPTFNRSTGTSTASLSFGPGTESDGRQYWEVNDTSSAGQYYTSATAPQAADNNAGWKATVTLKVLSTTVKSMSGAGTTSELSAAPVYFNIRNGHNIYSLGFTEDPATGQGAVYFLNGSGQFASGSNTATTTPKLASLDLSADYNTFSIVYTPDPTRIDGTNPTSYTGDSVNIYMNDALIGVINNTTLPGRPTSGTYAFALSSANGANYADYRFTYLSFDSTTALPEPTTATLLLAPATLLFRRRR